MSKYSIDSTTLTSIADAVRLKNGTSSPIVVSDLATKIREISTSSGENPNFTYPYNTQIVFPIGVIKLLSSYYQDINVIPIPYSVWSQYKNITFNYAISNPRRVAYDLNGSYINLFYSLARLQNNNIWNPSATSLYIKSSSKVSILSDFSGTLSDTYTINCENLEPITEDDYTYDTLVIGLQIKVYQSGDSSSDLAYRLGNFTGVEK